MNEEWDEDQELCRRTVTALSRQHGRRRDDTGVDYRIQFLCEAIKALEAEITRLKTTDPEAMEASPTPWKRGTDGLIYDANNEFVVDTCGSSLPNGEANQKLIVEAVNARLPPLPPCGMRHHHPTCTCGGMGGDR